MEFFLLGTDFRWLSNQPTLSPIRGHTDHTDDVFLLYDHSHLQHASHVRTIMFILVISFLSFLH
jgi:hypothetical protein